MGTDAKKKARKNIDSKSKQKKKGKNDRPQKRVHRFFTKKNLAIVASLAIIMTAGVFLGKQVYLNSKSPEYRLLSSMKMLHGEEAVARELPKRIVNAAGKGGATQLYVWEGEADKETGISPLLVAIPKDTINEGRLSYTTTKLSLNDDGSDFIEKEEAIQMDSKDYTRKVIADTIKSYLTEIGQDNAGFQVTETSGAVIAMLGAPDTDSFVQNFAFIMKKYQTLDTEAQFNLLKEYFDGRNTERGREVLAQNEA